MQRLEVSGAIRPLYGLLGVKGLILQHLVSEGYLFPSSKSMYVFCKLLLALVLHSKKCRCNIGLYVVLVVCKLCGA